MNKPRNRRGGGAILALALSLLAAPAPEASAHPGHGDAVVSIFGAAPVDHDVASVALDLAVENTTDAPAALLSLRAPVASRITIEQKAETGAWTALDALELGPGETIRLTQPAYRVLVETRAPQLFTGGGRFLIVADFGPLGEVAAHDRR